MRNKNAYSWDASLIGIEGDGPIEYPADEKRIYAPIEDGMENSNFSGQIFRELYERQSQGELGESAVLRERPSRAGKGINFSLENDKKYKIGSSVERVLKKHQIRKVAARHIDGD
tara:strand:- start:3401 stop:3745 length:345 start_codon:yes stop_codon:yes gene_type:complete